MTPSSWGPGVAGRGVLRAVADGGRVADPEQVGELERVASAGLGFAEEPVGAQLLRGWPSPLAWDEDGEIDDPAAGPAEWWRRSGRTTIPSAELVEDAEFARATGYRSLNERAMRPGVSLDRLEHAYMRAGRRQALAEREAG
jgi:hypothetical protein